MKKKILKKLNNDVYMNNDTSNKNNFMNTNIKIELTSSEKKNLINANR